MKVLTNLKSLYLQYPNRSDSLSISFLQTYLPNLRTITKEMA